MMKLLSLKDHNIVQAKETLVFDNSINPFSQFIFDNADCSMRLHWMDLPRSMQWEE